MAPSATDVEAEPASPSTPKRTRTKASTNGKSTRKMSDEHKAALAKGRAEGRIVHDYLDAIESHKPRRGRPVTTESIKERLDKVNAELVATTGVDRLRLIQKRMDLEQDLRRQDDSTEVDKLQEAFVKVAKDYAERSGMSYAAFREFGVAPGVLKEAGLTR